MTIIELSNNGIPNDLTNQTDETTEQQVEQEQPKEKENKQVASIDTQDRIKKLKALIALKRYIATFPEELNEIKSLVKPSLTIEQIQDLIQECQLLIRANSCNDFAISGCALATKSIENVVVNTFGISEMEGYTQSLFNNAAFVNCLKEVALMNSAYSTLSPQHQLFMLGMGTAVGLYSQKRLEKQEKQVESKEQPQE
jgi:hypothetical protein